MNSLNRAWLTRILSYNSEGNLEQIERAQLKRAEQRLWMIVGAAILVTFWMAGLAAQICDQRPLEPGLNTSGAGKTP